MFRDSDYHEMESRGSGGLDESSVGNTVGSYSSSHSLSLNPLHANKVSAGFFAGFNFELNNTGTPMPISMGLNVNYGLFSGGIKFSEDGSTSFKLGLGVSTGGNGVSVDVEKEIK